MYLLYVEYGPLRNSDKGTSLWKNENEIQNLYVNIPWDILLAESLDLMISIFVMDLWIVTSHVQIAVVDGMPFCLDYNNTHDPANVQAHFGTYSFWIYYYFWDSPCLFCTKFL